MSHLLDATVGRRRLADIRRRRRSGGFTMLELLVALAIVAFAAVLAVPRLAGPGPGQVMDKSVRDLAALLADARSQATGASRVVSVRLDVRERTVAIEGTDRRLALPAWIEVDASGATSSVVAPGELQLRFFPDGSSGGTEVVLRGRGRSARISVDWLTGRIAVAAGGGAR